MLERAIVVLSLEVSRKPLIAVCQQMECGPTTRSQYLASLF